MTAQLLDGNALGQKLRAGFKQRAEELAAQGVRPGLAVILVGEDPASQVYVRNKVNACQQAGFHSEKFTFAADVVPQVVLDKLAQLNADPKIHGILVQLPLPKQIQADESEILDRIDPLKDVDGFHPVNVGRLVTGQQALVPCTPHGCIRMLELAGIPIDGAHAVIIGRSNIVGKPMLHLLLAKNATVTICHSHTKDLAAITRQADILVAAVGRAGFVTADMVKPGATVIDVGINRIAPKKLAGDVDFEAVKEVAGAITPVPGGVGLLTIAMLMQNAVDAAELQLK